MILRLQDMMIDLRAHLLPGFPNGPADLSTGLELAGQAVADGILVSICTAPDYPGFSTTLPESLRRAVAEFGGKLVEASLSLHVVPGAEVHFRAGLAEALMAGHIQTLNNSRYVLIDLPPMVRPPRAEEGLRAILQAGFVPVLASPERLKWIDAEFDFFREIVRAGCWLQLSAGSLMGIYGKRCTYWAERLLGASLIHVMASGGAAPNIFPEALEQARRIVGEDEATHLVLTRPLIVLDDEAPGLAPAVSVTVSENWNPVADLRDLLKRAI